MFPWLILDILVFITANTLLLSYIKPTQDILGLITPLKLLILGLAVYRAANIVSNEFVTTPLRAYFVVEKEVNGEHIEEPRDEGFRGFAGSLLYCPSCTGVWIATILTYSYILWPAPTSLITLLLALSASERFFAYTFGKIKGK